MDKMAYVAMTGAKQTMLAQRVVSNNLANANTTGFRADLNGFTDRPVYGAGFPSRVNVAGAGASTDLTAASLITTGRPLDVAVDGDGWLAVQAPDGTEAYTRAGDLTVTSGGILTTGAGHPVMGDGGPVAVPEFSQVTVGRDGTVSIVPLGQTADTLAVVDRIRLVTAGDQPMVKGNDGLFRLADGSQATADASVTLVSEALESSNVNAAAALVDMIELARTFETQIKLIDTAKRNGDAASTIMRVR